MARGKHINWALFDKEWNYKGGVVTLKGVTPKDEGSNPEGYEEVQVKRFPQFHETWDPKSKSWKSDRAHKDKVAKRVDALEARRKGELDIPAEATQRWMLLLLERLGFKNQLTPALLQEFFPLVDRDKPHTSLRRKL